jgi:membrane protease YdiL (CAAX protease family)
MSYPSTRQYSYSAQMGFLIAFTGAGLITGTILSIIPLLGKINMADLKSGSSAKLMDNLLTPANAGPLMWVQFISTLFLFFLPVIFYALVCHKKPFTHLGFTHKVTVQEIFIAVAIMIACLPFAGVLSQLAEKLPFSKATLQHFKEAEEGYDKQVAVFTQMKTVGDYILSLIIMAFLPAVFEETFFRGGLQNLLSRWFKAPVFAVIITAVIFSAVHGSYLGFLSRAVLGFILGWMYYRTGNIWLNIIGHFTNNAIAVTSIYIAARNGTVAAASDADQSFPIWSGVVSLLVIIVLFILFEKICKKDIDHPGEEVLIPGYNYSNPFENNNDHFKNLN